MKLSVHLLRQPDAAALAHLRAHLDAEVHLTFGPDLPAPADYHILVAGRPQREHLTASPNLHALIIPWAGLPETTRDLMRDFPHISVHNLHHNAAPVAEMAVALMLAAAKLVVPADRALRAHDWTPRYHRPNPTILLEGRTALILGYGAIGQRAAHLCRALGMEVMAIRRHVAAPSPDAIYPPDALYSLLPLANVLIICLPQTPKTTGMIGEGELALLPSGAILVNVGRGPIVDEAALYHALREGTLHSAGLDVWYNYPTDEAARSHTPPSVYPFYELDNVVMSPHRAGGADGTETLRVRHLAALLNAAARGDEMPNRVDLQAGY
ncbi:MAG: hydroxyacid dehydrogenase [Chloroflexi bacterium]|nr:hydroxyacid dehydrogenase [Chloroflexota bacterium]